MPVSKNHKTSGERKTDQNLALQQLSYLMGLIRLVLQR